MLGHHLGILLTQTKYLIAMTTQQKQRALFVATKAAISKLPKRFLSYLLYLTFQTSFLQQRDRIFSDLVNMDFEKNRKQLFNSKENKLLAS